MADDKYKTSIKLDRDLKVAFEEYCLALRKAGQEPPTLADFINQALRREIERETAIQSAAKKTKKPA